MAQTRSKTKLDNAVVRQQRMSLWEYITLLPGVMRLGLVMFKTIIAATLRNVADKTLPKTWWLYVGYAYLRRAPLIFTTLQLQFLQPNVEQVYNQCVKKYKQAPVTVDLGHGGAKGHWLGNPNAKNVLIYYHGGGFALPANDGYFNFLYKFVQEMQSLGKDFGVFAITYTLAPHATYPTQLIQAVAALRYIVETTHRDPSKVYLGGDSAGGNLTLNVLAHLSHPHPAISPLPVSAPLGGAFMIAPWTDLRLHFDPVEFPQTLTEPLGDLVSPEIAPKWAKQYVGDAERDNYTDPSNAPTSWWKDLKVKELLVVAGGNEILLPMVEDLVKKIKTVYPNVTFFVGEREAHVAPMFNLHVGDQTETDQGKKIKSWLRELVV